METTRLCKAGGFSLVELLVAMTLFLVASMGLLPLLLGNLHANRNNLLHRQAQALAGSALARLQVVAYQQLSGIGTTNRQHGLIEVEELVEPETPTAGQAQITVTARWQEGSQTRRYQLQIVRSAE